MSGTYRTTAIVLKSKEIGEADRLLTVFSQHYGKKILVAKGVRKPKSRKSGHLQPFNLVKLFMAKTRGIDIITEVETMFRFSQIGQSLTKTSQACYLAELVDQLEPFEQPNKKVFALLKHFLTQLNQQILTEGQLFNYTFQLTQLIGFGPPSHVKTLSQLEAYLQTITEKPLVSKELLKKTQESLKS